MASLRASELAVAGTSFALGDDVYVTTGFPIGHGGMGNAFLVHRKHARGGPDEECVAKVFHAEYLYQLRSDAVTQLDHAIVMRHADSLAALAHPNLLPLYATVPIVENYLTLTPRRATTLRNAIAAQQLSPRRRVELFTDALRGLARLHEAGFIHRDVTLRNILVDQETRSACLFDFDLTLALVEVAHESYLSHYQGRIFGSPGYSVAPEVVDEVLMERRISPRLDLYAVGASLFALFSDELPYGPSEDMWSLLVRISEGIVREGHSHIVYPAEVPLILRPIIEGCLERDPDQRTARVVDVIARLEQILPELAGDTTEPGQRRVLAGEEAGEAEPTRAKPRRVTRENETQAHARRSAVHATARDPLVTFEKIEEVDAALAYHGYQIERALGQVKGHPIFLAVPDPELVTEGLFPDSNTYPKIVTALSLALVPEREALVDHWLGGYLPILKAARQGLMTSLYRAVWDEPNQLLLLFSEYVDDARFGTELDRHRLSVSEALGLGYLVARQVRRLHVRGLAHNNICAASLLLKGVRESRKLHPAMVGIVAPSFDPDDMATDVQQLAGLILSWLGEDAVAELSGGTRTRVRDCQARLEDLSRGREDGASIDGILAALASGMAALDPNFRVLSANGGDLDAYALLLVSHSLYGRLW